MSQQQILDLPDELVIQIIAWMEFDTLINFICTCRNFYNSTSTGFLNATYKVIENTAKQDLRYWDDNFPIFTRGECYCQIELSPDTVDDNFLGDRKCNKLP